jgi:hypothetical protein
LGRLNTAVRRGEFDSGEDARFGFGQVFGFLLERGSLLEERTAPSPQAPEHVS